MTIEHEFLDALANAGLQMSKPEIIADGHIHRFHVKGDRAGSVNGWYKLVNDAFPAGVFGSWKTSEKHTWKSCVASMRSSEELASYKLKAAVAAEERKRAERDDRMIAQLKAAAIWNSAPAAPTDHSYLLSKRVKCHGLRLHHGALVVPMHDADGTLHSLQFIHPDGSKRFLRNGRKNGCYYGIGVCHKQINICEGYATAASVYEAAGDATAVAFDAYNLVPVALSLRQKFPTIALTVCADNDVIGISKAVEAAAAVGGLVAIAEAHHG